MLKATYPKLNSLVTPKKTDSSNIPCERTSLPAPHCCSLQSKVLNFSLHSRRAFNQWATFCQSHQIFLSFSNCFHLYIHSIFDILILSSRGMWGGRPGTFLFSLSLIGTEITFHLFWLQISRVPSTSDLPQCCLRNLYNIQTDCDCPVTFCIRYRGKSKILSMV